MIKNSLRALFSKLTINVKNGPLKGWKVSVASGTRFIKGSYEPEKTLAFNEHVKNGDFVLDIGGHIGYFALLASKLSGKQGLVWVFEPLPRNYKILNINLNANKAENTVHHIAAVSDFNGTANFNNATGSGTGHLSNTGAVQVKVIKIDDMNLPRAPNLIKIDIEGGEIGALQGMASTVTTHKPIMLVAVHSAQLKHDAEGLLTSWGYGITVLNPAATKGDIELLALPR
jgi:FkbM family methyltransferase